MSEAPSLLFVGSSADEPVHLSGPPRRLTGQLRLRNAQPDTLVLRNAGITDRSGRLADLHALQAFAPVVLRPAEERAVPLAIALDPATPAGEYRVDLELMGHRQPAILDVAETVAVRVEPKRIVLIDDGERSRRTQIVVTNEGNVALSLGALGPVDLRDDVTEVRDLRGVVAPLLAELPGKLDDLVAVLLAVLPPQGPIVGRLAVRLHGAPVELAPGRTRKIDLDIDVPPGLHPNARYRGRIAVLTADLEFVVVTSARAASYDEPRTEERQTPRDVQRAPGGASGPRKKEGGRR